MAQEKRIAVLMPAYNPGSEIELTLDSLRAQTVPFKLFVIDDGSARKPDYAALLAGFNHHLILSPRNLGVNEARNPALQKILNEGFDYIALIDCGDVCMPQRLAMQSSFLDSNPGIAIVGSNVELVYGEEKHNVILKFPETPQGTRRSMLSIMPVSHPSLMIRSDVFKTIGLYSARFEAAEDYDMIRRADRAGFAITNMHDILVRKIETSESISVKKRDKQLRSRFAIQKHYMNWMNPVAWKGLARTAALIVTPYKWVMALKGPAHRFHKTNVFWI
jgi:glycosyltransferase involved in cell wall biosynthesis